MADRYGNGRPRDQREPDRASTGAREHAGSETIDDTQVHGVLEAQKEMTGGRGPNACIDAVGMEAHGTGAQYAYDRVKQALRLETGRGQALREAAMAYRKGGTLSVLGVYGMIDKVPMGVIMSKDMTVRAAQQPGQAYMDRLRAHAQKGEPKPASFATPWLIAPGRTARLRHVQAQDGRLHARGVRAVGAARRKGARADAVSPLPSARLSRGTSCPSPRG